MIDASKRNSYDHAIRSMRQIGHNDTVIPMTGYFKYYKCLEGSGFCRFNALDWLSTDNCFLNDDNRLARRIAFLREDAGLACYEQLGDAVDVARSVMIDIYEQYGNPDDSHDVVPTGTVRDFSNHFARTERAKSVVRLAFDVSTASDRMLIGELNEVDRLAVQMIWKFCDPYMRLLPFRLDWSCIDRQYSLFQEVFTEETHDTVVRLAANYYRADSLFKMVISPRQYSCLQLASNQDGFKVIEHLVSVLNNLGDMFSLPIEAIKSQRAIALEKGCREIKKRLLDADKELERLIFKQFSGEELEWEFRRFIGTTYYKYLMAKEATRVHIECNDESDLAYIRNWLEVQGNSNVAIAMAIMDGALGLYKGPKTLMKVLEWLSDGCPDETRQMGDVVLYCRWPVQYLVSKGRLMLMKTIWGVEF